MIAAGCWQHLAGIEARRGMSTASPPCITWQLSAAIRGTTLQRLTSLTRLHSKLGSLCSLLVSISLTACIVM